MGHVTQHAGVGARKRFGIVLAPAITAGYREEPGQGKNEWQCVKTERQINKRSVWRPPADVRSCAVTLNLLGKVENADPVRTLTVAGRPQVKALPVLVARPCPEAMEATGELL